MRVLLLDTAFAAAPIYDYLIEAGHDVWVMGNRSSDVLAKRAGNQWLDQDYSRVEEVRAQIGHQRFEYIVPGCTDVSLDTCSKLQSDHYPLDSAETNRILSDKWAFRQLCRELNLPAPREIKKSEFPAPGKFICKPVDAFSGRGITVFDGEDYTALNDAYKLAIDISPGSTALIESFISGDLYSCSAFVERQKLTTSFYVREGSSANPYAVDTSYLTDDVPFGCKAELVESLEKICSALELRDGLLHTQFVLDPRQRPSIIEVSRRCPGDLYSLLIEYSTGFPYAAKYASYFIGVDLNAKPIFRRCILRHTVTSGEEAGILTGIRMRELMPLRAFFPINSIGHELLTRQGSRAGLLFCEAPTHDELICQYERFVERRAYQVT